MSNRGLTMVTTRVTLRGKDMGVHPVSWSASITNDLPARFTTGDSVEQRTGTIYWKPSNLIYDGISPLHADYPRPGDPVIVTAEVTTHSGTATRRVFTGVVFHGRFHSLSDHRNRAR